MLSLKVLWLVVAIVLLAIAAYLSPAPRDRLVLLAGMAIALALAL